MNNRPFNRVLNKSFHHPFKLFLILFGAFILAGLTVSAAFGQKATWRYVTTVPGSTKAYLNDEIKSLAGKNKTAWEKAIKADGSAIIALAEWDCAGKTRRTRQLTFYNPDQTVIGTKRKGFESVPVIPSSLADFIYRRVCLTAAPPAVAEIVSSRAALRVLPDNAAPIVRTGRRGERFEIIPESGLGGWFNLVDAATQEDYWLTSDGFKIIKTQPSPSEPQAGSDKPSRRTKPKAKTRKN